MKKPIKFTAPKYYHSTTDSCSVDNDGNISKRIIVQNDGVPTILTFTYRSDSDVIKKRIKAYSQLVP